VKGEVPDVEACVRVSVACYWLHATYLPQCWQTTSETTLIGM